MAFLKQLDNNKNFELEVVESILGRHPNCQVQIEAGAVSRHHAKVVREGQDFHLVDLKSRNFTFLNDDKLEEEKPYKLNHGDRITICDVQFVFQDKDSDESSRVEFVMDEDECNSTIMSKLDVSSRRNMALSVSPEVKLRAMVEITHTLGNTLALDEVLPKVLDSLFAIFIQADRGFVGLRDESGKLGRRWTKSRREDGEDTIRISNTIVNRVMDSKEAVLSADAANDERFEMSQSIADFRIRSMMCAPLFDSEGNSIGVLQLDTLDQRKRFQEEDLEVLASVASQAGISIDNARLHEQTLKQQAVERDLELAHEVQKSFLPDNRPQIDGYEFFDYYEPANHVGGDYFDYIHLPDGKIAIIVADVVGHGVAAALLMAKLSAESRFCLASASPAEALSILNDRMSKIHLDRFVTIVIAVLDPSTHEVTIANGGHMCPMWKKSGGVDEPGEEEKGLPIMVVEGMPYDSCTIALGPGESLTLYTDGLNEAVDPSGDVEFSIERIRSQVAGAEPKPEVIGESIISAVKSFCGGGEQADDMCLVSFGRTS